MNKLSLAISHCYGINEIDHTFCFGKGNTHLVYAQNGVMKTSLTKTFEDIVLGRESKDRINGITGVRSIKGDEIDITPEQIIVIHSNTDNIQFEDKVSTILVNKKLKKEYDEQLKLISGEQDKFLSLLRGALGKRSNEDALKELCIIFGKEDNEILEYLESLEGVIHGDEIGYELVSYTFMFDDKVINLLKDPVMQKKIDNYIKVYDQLIKKTNFLRKGFNHQNAEEIAGSLEKKGFFEAEHSVVLQDATGVEMPMKTSKDLMKALESDQEKILSDPALRKEFKELDKELNKNNGLQNFRGYINDNPHLINELSDIKEFRRKVILSYIQKSSIIYNDWVNLYKGAKMILASIVKKANEEQDEWLKIIQLYNDKFDVPFQINIKNQTDILLKEKVPMIEFIYRDNSSGINKGMNQTELLTILSTGEKRALYILNVLFELEGAKKEGNKKIILIDDIADSFDYRNKYAIIEYLRDLSEQETFYLFILTHNFDFFRSVQSRLKISRTLDLETNNCWLVQKERTGLMFNFTNDLDVFKGDLRNNFHKDRRKFICSIPFVRNLIEYTKGDSDLDYKKLTSVIHIKPDSDALLVKDIKDIISTLFGRDIILDELKFDGEQKIQDMINEEAALIFTETIEDPRIINKLILSISIRLKAEEFMFREMPDLDIATLGNNQTGKLLGKYKIMFPSEDNNIRVLQRVLLITSENIHLNSFMYEPILDMTYQHLKNLFTDIKEMAA